MMKTYEEVIKYIKENKSLPEGFGQWELKSDNGWTIFHEAACLGLLPKNFDQWDLADDYGRPVAHVAACMGLLPKNFNQWDLKNRYGDTVFEVLLHNSFLQSFIDWDMVINENGETCRDVYKRIKGEK